jgi:hypothetical protein
MNIMLDLETMSSKPDAAIVSIGACTFADDGSITPNDWRNTFYCVVDAENSQRVGGRVDAGTMKWWMQQTAEARAVFNAPGAMTLVRALLAFERFCTMWPEVCVWGNGASFDNVVLRQSYERLNGKAPWSYRGERCYRTLKNLRPDVALTQYGTAHNALDDAIAQAAHAEEIFKAMKASEVEQCAAHI